MNLLLRVKCKQHPHSCLISNVHKMPSPWRLTCYDSTPKACDWPTAGGSAMCFCLNKPAGTHRGEWMREAPQTHTLTHTLWAGLICWHNDSLRSLGADTCKEILSVWLICWCILCVKIMVDTGGLLSEWKQGRRHSTTAPSIKHCTPYCQGIHSFKSKQ